MLIQNIQRNCPAPLSNTVQQKKSFSTKPYANDCFKPSFSGNFWSETAENISLFANNAAREILDGKLTTAEAHLNHVSPNTKSPEINFLRGTIEHLKAVSSKEKDNETVKTHLENAMKYYTEAIENSSENQRILISSHIQKNGLLQLNEDVQGALNELDTAIKLRHIFNPAKDDPNSSLTQLTEHTVMTSNENLSEAYLTKAVLHLFDSDINNAFECSKKSVLYNPYSPSSHSIKGQILQIVGLAAKDDKEKEKYFTHAEKDLQKAVKYSGRHPEMLSNLAELYKIQGKNKQALGIYKKLLRIDPENKEALLSEGLLNMVEKKPAAAIFNFNVILRETSNSKTDLRQKEIAAKYKKFVDNGYKIDDKLKKDVQNIFIADVLRKLKVENS